MMYFLLGLSIALAALLTFNSIASLFASLLWRVLGQGAQRFSAASSASIIFLLRIFPIVAGTVCVVMLLAPAYLAHEPRTSHEDISLKLAIIAAASAVGLALALFRVIAAWRATSRLTLAWMCNADPFELPQIGIPAFLIEHPFPVIAIVGMLRPRLFIANKVLTSLTPSELLAAIEHETGHVVAYDNLKRGLMRACRDVLVVVPCGRRLDRAWLEASEAAADEFAAGRGSRTALDLASALVKIARLVPTGVRPAMPVGAFLIEADDSGGVKARVRRLMQLANNGRDSNANGIVFKIPMWIPIALTVMVAAISATEPHVLASVHWLMEHAVHLLN
jgi:Zn-dependent protease with chaperone function